MMSALSSGGVDSSVSFTVSTTCETGSAMASRTSAGTGTEQVVGSQVFYQIDSITAVTEGTPGGGDTVSFGCGTGLGIPYRIGAETDILAKRVDGTQDTTGVVTINANGWAKWVGASLPNATRKFFCTLKSTYGIP